MVLSLCVNSISIEFIYTFSMIAGSVLLRCTISDLSAGQSCNLVEQFGVYRLVFDHFFRECCQAGEGVLQVIYRLVFICIG